MNKIKLSFKYKLQLFYSPLFIAGMLFFLFGSLTIILVMSIDYSKHYALSKELIVTNGVLTDLEIVQVHSERGIQSNSMPTCYYKVTYDYTFTTNNDENQKGRSYRVFLCGEFADTLSISDTIPIEYNENQITASRVAGTRGPEHSLGVLFFLIFPTIGILILLIPFNRTRKLLAILKNGEFCKGEFTLKNNTGYSFLGKKEIKYRYTYMVRYRDYNRFFASYKVVDMSKQALIIYLDAEPKNNVLINGLPDSVQQRIMQQI